MVYLYYGYILPFNEVPCLTTRAKLKEKIGIPFSEVALENKLRPLIGNRIVHPDGTVNSFIQRYLREQVLKLFEVKPKKSVKKG